MLDYGCVLTPDIFESKKSFSDARNEFAKIIKKYFGDSSFYKNTGNENYVARSYMMAKKMCENSQFSDITDIYASDICLVEHSYGYNSTEVMLSDTQVVSLEGKLEEGDFDTDRDEVLDRDELGTLEEVNISRLLEAYIKYNELDQVEADKLRLNPTVQMYNYISNPVLPDSDFDGRGDLRDRGRALDNSYEMLIDTDVVDSANYDLNVDYRYFFMDNTKYYPELSDMAVLLSNMVTKKGWRGKSWHNKTENLGDTDIQSFMWHYGNEDIEVHDMSSYYDDANVCRYAIGQHDVVLRRGKVNNKVRNVITVAIGEIPEKTAELTANLYGLLGDNEEYSEYHHIGYDITAGRIFEKLLRYTENYNNNQKVFFITGARSAGGVANLLSKKLIDRFGPSSVYGYTFNAVSTINGNMIPEGTKIPNLKYAPIMNIYNDDEIMVMFTSEETNMYKYGTNVHMSLSENLTSKVEKAFRKVHKGSYDTLGVKEAKEFIEDYLLSIKEGIIYAMMGKLDLNNVFSGETTEEIQILTDHWKKLYESMPNNIYYEEYYNICKARLDGEKIDCFEDYVAYLISTKETEPKKETSQYFPKDSKGTSVTEAKTMKEALDHIANWYVNNVYTYLAGEYGAHRYNMSATTVEQVKVYYDGDGKKTLLDAKSSPIYLAGNNGRVGRALNNDINIVEQENLYQYYFKVFLRKDLDAASNAAKKKCKNVLESQSKKLNVNQNPIHIVGEYEIFDNLIDVDIWKNYEYAFLKSKGRTDATPTSRVGYYNSDIAQYVCDDCSGFVSAVIGYLLKHNASDYQYRTYNSRDFYKGSDSVNELLSKYNFECYEGDILKDKSLKYGDILVRERHVEFYIDSGKSFGWGRMHSTFEGNDKNIRFEPKFNVDNNGEYYYLGSDNQIYTKVYRYVG